MPALWQASLEPCPLSPRMPPLGVEEGAPCLEVGEEVAARHLEVEEEVGAQCLVVGEEEEEVEVVHCQVDQEEEGEVVEEVVVVVQQFGLARGEEGEAGVSLAGVGVVLLQKGPGLVQL